MRVDCHVHLSAMTPGNGSMSPRLSKSIPFVFLRHKFGMKPDASLDAPLVAVLKQQIESAGNLDAVTVLAFDAVYATDGRRDDVNTHLYLANDYVAALCQDEPRFLFGCSVHPYRKDALAELGRCVAAGAVLCKWLPITQGIDPSDQRCYPFYEALAHYGLPLLSHTGGETMLPNVNRCADPTLLLPAVRRGVKVVAAHCGTQSKPWETDHVNAFVRMALDHEHVYGDTSALNWPFRWHAYKAIFGDPRVMAKVIHGSDWPVIPIPHPGRLGLGGALAFFEDENWLRRDVAIKAALGFDDAFFDRAAKVLRIPAAL
ncbi:MAG TPA: amidohydrolase family protein [Tepidisphaeraceae bacterium]|jgi:predicted TIM-barrel fold metal-dependent hydrolase